MSSHASPEAAADDRSPDPAPALTSDFNIPRGAEDPPGPASPGAAGSAAAWPPSRPAPQCSWAPPTA